MVTKKKAIPKKKTGLQLTKRETLLVQVISESFVKAMQAYNLTGGGPASNFSYEFSLKGCTVTNFVVGHYISDRPLPTGNFYTPVYDPSTPPEIHVVVVAAQDLPVCTGTLSLKYMGKDVFSAPKQIIFSNGMGSINENVKLPL